MIELIDVSFRYAGGSAKALNGVTIGFERRKIYSLVGPNGSGKSTLLRLLNGLIPHFYRGEMTGRVLVDGVDTREASVAELSRRVGLVFQNPEHMFFSETVYEEVAFGPKSLGFDESEMRESVEWALNKVGLWELRERSPWSLSGGEMKRLSIACVLAMRTDYLAIDEPTIGQDSVSKENLRRILRDLVKEEKGIIVVTHDLEWLDDLDPDEVIVLKEGSVVKRGSKEEVLSDLRMLALNRLLPPHDYILRRLIPEVIGNH